MILHSLTMLIEILHKLVEQRYRRHGFKSKLLDVAPFRMHYYERRDSNSSKYLLFLHGLGTSSSTWVRTIPKLPQEWNILALDLPGFGMSSVDDVKSVPQFEELYQSVVLFVERMVPVPFTLVGQSLGGWLAATFAARHSQLVRHLILVNNAGIFCDGA
ncbi:MAG TPA: alpha/beta fold hydrolase, partial [Bacteroidota bacterium]